MGESSYYLNDTWTHDVAPLAYLPLRDELAEMARQCQPPFAAAIYGGWGSGKTSLLRALMNRLGGDLVQLASIDALLENPTELDQASATSWKNFQKDVPSDDVRPCVWFNPWQHQFEAHPLIALLHEIRKQFSNRLKVKHAATKVGFVALKTGLRLMDELIASSSKAFFGMTTPKIDIEKVEVTGGKYEKEHYMETLDSQRFQMHFEAAIAHLTSNGKTPDPHQRLVIFIDDLDRCESGQVLKLLEAIKLYLSTQKCVFFLGLDREHIERALCAAGLRDEQHARSYLQKLFQTSIHLPKPNNLPLFIKGLFAQIQPNMFPKADWPAHTTLLAEILEPNPRRIKNFINQVFFHARVFQTRQGTVPDFTRMALLLALRNYYPEVYSSLEVKPNNLNGLLASLAYQNPRDATRGYPAFVARHVYLPQLDGAIQDDDNWTNYIQWEAVAKGHYGDARGFFEVLARFKLKFGEFFKDLPTKDLNGYL